MDWLAVHNGISFRIANPEESGVNYRIFQSSR